MSASDVAVLELVHKFYKPAVRLAPCACPNPKMPLLGLAARVAPQTAPKLRHESNKVAPLRLTGAVRHLIRLLALDGVTTTRQRACLQQCEQSSAFALSQQSPCGLHNRRDDGRASGRQTSTTSGND